uniref:Sushi domain-containing protein n=1 Tax=Romanomermis culicivorax TaxID=13658 RepID=A0A915IMD4_ROMCU
MQFTTCILRKTLLIIVITNYIGTKCPLPGVPENGQVIMDKASNASLNSRFYHVDYRCDDGFVLIGPSRIFCDPTNSSWSAETPVCATNVALFKPAVHSSTHSDTLTNYHANLSTDGITNGQCSSTRLDDRDPWLQIDLLAVYDIHAVELKFPITERDWHISSFFGYTKTSITLTRMH